MSDPIRAGIQQYLDELGDGWHLAHYVIALGIERVTADGNIESTPWYYAPPNQAEYVTDGLLDAVQDMRIEPADHE